jgi:hypothetical protein
LAAERNFYDRRLSEFRAAPLSGTAALLVGLGTLALLADNSPARRFHR